MKRTLWILSLLLLLTGSPLVAATFEGRDFDFHGFKGVEFKHAGRTAKVVLPETKISGMPWIWRARFFGHEPQTDIELLKKGWHVAFIDVAGLYGGSEAIAIWDSFFKLLTEEHGFSNRPALEGMSRGGLIIFNWAAANPDKVSSIYADAPVCDIRSWPGGKGKAKGSPRNWTECLRAHGLTEESSSSAMTSPIHVADRIAQAGIPVLCVVGDADDVVPVLENTAIMEKIIRKQGGSIQVLHKPGVGHHPHSLNPPDTIVGFILANAK